MILSTQGRKAVVLLVCVIRCQMAVQQSLYTLRLHRLVMMGTLDRCYLHVVPNFLLMCLLVRTCKSDFFIEINPSCGLVDIHLAN